MMVNSNTTKKWDRYIEIYYFYLQCWVDKVQVVIDNIKYSFIDSDLYTKDIWKLSMENTPEVLWLNVYSSLYINGK